MFEEGYFFVTTREQVEDRRQHAYEGYERDIFERFATDEKTRVSEQINGVMEHSFDYAYGPGGELYFQGEPLSLVFARGIERAEVVVQEHPQFMVELLRRHIESRQYQSQRRVGQQAGEDDPYILLHISMMPEAVNHGVDLGAYDTRRQKIMIRVTEPVEGGVRTTSASLDGGNRLGVQAMADACEADDIPEGATPEDILAMDFWVRRSHLGDDSATTFFRKKYDAALAMQYGGAWYAGRQDSPIIGTLQLIEQYPEHTSQYVRAVYALKQTYGDNYEASSEYKTLNYDFVKLMERLGREPDYAGSATAAGGEARANGETVAEPDCPTGSNLPAQNQLSAEQALALQGIGLDRNGEYIDTCMKCPKCQRINVKVTVRDKQLYYTCVATGGCGASTLPHKRTKQTTPRQTSLAGKQAIEERPVTSKDDLTRRKYGKYAIMKQVISVGGADRYVVDRRTQEIYAKL